MLLNGENDWPKRANMICLTDFLVSYGRPAHAHVLEYVDHYERDEGTGISWSLFGSGAVLKRKAYGLAVGFLQHENLD